MRALLLDLEVAADPKVKNNNHPPLIGASRRPQPLPPVTTTRLSVGPGGFGKETEEERGHRVHLHATVPPDRTFGSSGRVCWRRGY